MLRPPHGLPRHDTLNQAHGASPLPSPVGWQTSVKQLSAFLRLLAGLAILSAVIGQFVFTVGRATINPFNFFGYVTIQSNIITMVAFFASAYFILRRKTQPAWLIFLRAIATTIIVLVGLVYNTLFPGPRSLVPSTSPGRATSCTSSSRSMLWWTGFSSLTARSCLTTSSGWC